MESADVGTEIFVLIADDPDSGVNAQMFYELWTDSLYEHFELTREGGKSFCKFILLVVLLNSFLKFIRVKF